MSGQLCLNRKQRGPKITTKDPTCFVGPLGGTGAASRPFWSAVATLELGPGKRCVFES